MGRIGFSALNYIYWIEATILSSVAISKSR